MAVPPIRLVTHESDTRDAKVDFVAVVVLVAALVVVQPARVAVVEEGLPRRRANQLHVKLVVVPLVVESTAAE